MSNNYNENILQAMDTVITQRLKEINYDVTIPCTIISKKNDYEYVVKSENSSFTAYSDNRVYKEKQKVYVTIPQNDYSNKKIIIGTYTGDINTSWYADPFSNFVDATGNLVKNYDEDYEYSKKFDYDNNGVLNKDDAMYLLFHVNFPEDYPIDEEKYTRDVNEDGNIDLDDPIELLHRVFNGLYISTTQNQNKTVSEKISFDIPTLPEELGEPQYIGLEIEVENYMPDTDQGVYGVNLVFSNKEGFEYVNTFDSTEFYGNPYMYDSGFKQKKVFEYPKLKEFKKGQIELFQDGTFNNNGLIIISKIYICFGYDKSKFQKNKFYINLTKGETKYSLTQDNLIKIESSLFKFDTKSLETETIFQPEETKWFRYKAGSYDLGAGVSWEQLFKYEENSSQWLEQNQYNKYRYEAAKEINIALDQLNASLPLEQEEEELQKIKEMLYLYQEDYGDKAIENPYEPIKTDGIYEITNFPSNYEIFNQIEQPFNGVFSNIDAENKITQIIGKTNEGEYHLFSFPNMNYEQEQIKAVITVEEKKYQSQTIQFNYYGEKIINPEEESQNDSLSQIKLEATQNGIYWVHGENGEIISDQSLSDYKVAVSFINGGEWTSANRVVWKFNQNALIEATKNQGDREIKIENGYYIITVEKNNGSLSNTLPFIINKVHSRSKEVLTIYCNVYYNDFSMVTQKTIDLYFNKLGSSGTDYTLYLTDDNNQAPWNCLTYDSTKEEQDKKQLRAHIMDLNQNEIELTEEEKKKFKWEWLYDDESATKVVMHNSEENGPTNHNSFSVESFGNYCNSILKVSYPFPVANDHIVELVCYHPIAVTNDIYAIGVTGMTEVIYDVNGNYAENYEKEYYEVKRSSGSSKTVVCDLKSDNKMAFLPQIKPVYNETERYMDYMGAAKSENGFQTGVNSNGPVVRYYYLQHNAENNSEPLKPGDYIIFRNSTTNDYSSNLNLNVRYVRWKGFSFDNNKLIDYGTIVGDEIQLSYRTKVSKQGVTDYYFQVPWNETIDAITDGEGWYIFVTIPNIEPYNLDGTILLISQPSASFYLQPYSLNGQVQFDEFPWLCNNIEFTIGEYNLFYQQPILLRYNRYGTKLINNWNGDYVVDTENNAVFSSLLVAGEKNEENQFTGVVIGDVRKIDNENKNYGVYGYKNGVKSFSIDENGDAYLAGKIESNEGQIGGIQLTDNEIISKSDNGLEQFKVTKQGEVFVKKLKIDDGNLKASDIEAQNVKITSLEIKDKGSFIVNIDNVSNTNSGYYQNYLEPREAFRANIDTNSKYKTYQVKNWGSGWYNQQYFIAYDGVFEVTFAPDDSGYLPSTFITSKGGKITGNTEQLYAGPTENNKVAYMNERIDKITIPAGSYGCYLVRNTHKNNYDNVTGGSYWVQVSTQTGSKFQVTENGQLIAEGASITTGSDETIKNSIEPLSSKYLNLIKNLTPSRYKYNENTSGRFHTGFISQDVKRVMEESGLAIEELAALVDVNYNTSKNPLWYLHYEEFIALNTLAIQDLYKYIETLEARIQELEKKEDKVE